MGVKAPFSATGEQRGKRPVKKEGWVTDPFNQLGVFNPGLKA